jgi:hypothetical protein
MHREAISHAVLCLPLLFAFQGGACHTSNANVGPSANMNRNANVTVGNVNTATGNSNMQNENVNRTSAQASDTIKAGTWGGPQIGMAVTSASAEINYPCAHGSIKGPLTLDRNGNFDLTGTHISEHPGPVRLGEDNSHPARYTGKVTGDQITIKVTLTDTKEEIGTFTLTYGRGGRVPRCA